MILANCFEILLEHQKIATEKNVYFKPRCEHRQFTAPFLGNQEVRIFPGKIHFARVFNCLTSRTISVRSISER